MCLSHDWTDFILLIQSLHEVITLLTYLLTALSQFCFFYTSIGTSTSLCAPVTSWPISFFHFFFSCCPIACGVPGTRDQIRAAVVTAIPDPLTHCARPCIKLATWHWRHDTGPTVPQWKLLAISWRNCLSSMYNLCVQPNEYLSRSFWIGRSLSYACISSTYTK